MRFGEHFIDELKARVRVSEVVGKHVKLKRQGREFAGLSPFTNEKTPSFFVNDEKGFYHCFSSGKHGDGISFLMETEGLSFPEAVERLAVQVGMPLPEIDPEAEKRAEANKKTINWISQAQGFFQRSLRQPEGAEARTYLKSRGLNGEDCKRFGIGFAPDSFDGLRDDLTRQGASLNALVEAGLLIDPDDRNKKPWDRFRNRIMFPIADPRGRLIAFGGRAMDKDAKAKYLNSPETGLFHKGKLLYRYPEARKSLHTPKNGARGLIVAEGYMDVIALAKAGFEHACAPLGTALTEEQIELLWRAGPEPTLCFDGDKAGLRAAFRSVERVLPLLRPAQTIRFALLPDGLDPDDLIRAHGAQAMQAVIERSIPLVEMLWRREVDAETLDTPEAKAGLRSRLFAAVNEITDKNVQAQYKTDLLQRFDKEFGKPAWTPGRYQPGKAAKRKLSAAQIDKAQPNAMRGRREDRLLAAILQWPELLESVDQTLFSLQLQSGDAKSLQNMLLNYWQDTIAVDKRALHAHIETNGLGKAVVAAKRERSLTIAAFGGAEASPEDRLKFWRAEARSLDGAITASTEETYDRMTESIRAENKDAIVRLKRSRSSQRDKMG